MKKLLLPLIFSVALQASPVDSLSFEADFLYWKPRGFLVLGDQSLGTIEGVTIDIYSPTATYEPGYRLGFYYDDPWDQVKLGVIWSHLHGSFTESILPVGPYWLLTLYSDELSIGILSDFIGSNRIVSKLDIIDFDAAYSIKLLSSLDFTPHVGIRILRFKENLFLNVSGNFNFNPTSLERTYRDQISGYGIEGGIGIEWRLVPCFSLFGHVGGSVQRIFRKESKKFIETDLDLQESVLYTSTLVRESSSFMLNSALGFSYITQIVFYPLEIQIAWEQVYLGFYDREWDGLTFSAILNY